MRPVRLTRAEQQAVTRERLLAAAERVLAGHGYGGASIDLITAEAGYSKGAIYSNFESKEAVFLELLRVYMERDMAELGRIVSLPPHQLSAALGAWLETMHCESDCPLLVTELQLHARRNPVFAKRYYALQDQQTRADIHQQYMAQTQAGYDAHNAQFANYEWQRSRNAADFNESIIGTRTIYDTVTGESGYANLSDVNGVVDSLNQAALDPNRFVQIPLRDQLYPNPPPSK